MTPHQERTRQRNESIAAYRKAGYSESAVARLFGLTPRRIRQIVANLGHQVGANRQSSPKLSSGSEFRDSPQVATQQVDRPRLPGRPPRKSLPPRDA